MSDSPELLELEASYGPASKPPPAHWHPSHDERFTVLEGEMRVRLAGKERSLHEGEVLEIPRGTAHAMWNPTERRARTRWENRPAGRVREWFEQLDALNRAGKVDERGIPSVPVLAALLTEYRDVFRLAAGADIVVRTALATLAPLGRGTLKSVR